MAKSEITMTLDKEGRDLVSTVKFMSQTRLDYCYSRDCIHREIESFQCKFKEIKIRDGRCERYRSENDGEEKEKSATNS